jgi:hypothetical protein
MDTARVFLLAFALFAAACSSPRYVYRYEAGKTAVLREGRAVAPVGAPAPVVAAIAAGNRIAGMPYRYGGGHGLGAFGGYDCSGSTSYVLHAAGLLAGGQTNSDGFRHYGKSGTGKWITVYASHGHVFLSVAGLRFDTGWGQKREGPQWTTKSRPADGTVLRHPSGL